MTGPCRSNEDWHRKADRTGMWMDGLLVDQAFSDEEIMSLLGSHHITMADDIRISPPYYVGYYIEAEESRFQQVSQSINSSETNISFSDAGMWEFIPPVIRHQGNNILVPAFLATGPGMNQTMTYRDLVDRGIPVKKARIVEIYDLQARLSPADREGLLRELSRDDRVLFSFKEYLEGVMCEYPP